MQNSTNPVGDKRTAKPSSNLVLKNQIRSQDDQNGSKSKVKAIKCVCRKSWCANCGIRNAIKRFVERMLDWNWQHVIAAHNDRYLRWRSVAGSAKK